MIIRTSRTFFKILLLIILIWACINFASYLILNKLMQNGYFKNVIIEKLLFDSELDYQMKGVIKIHWNPFSFGANISHFRFHDSSYKLIDWRARNVDLKFSIIKLASGNFIPRKIYLDNGSIFINQSVVIERTKEEQSDYDSNQNYQRIFRYFKNFKIIAAKDLAITLVDKENKSFNYFEKLTSNRKRNNLYIESSYRNNLFKKIDLKSIVNLPEPNDEQKIASFRLTKLIMEANNLQLFPKIDVVKINAYGSGSINFDNHLTIEKIDFNLNDVGGEIIESKIENNQQEKKFIQRGNIVGSFEEQVLSIFEFNFDFEKSYIAGDAKFDNLAKSLHTTLYIDNLFIREVINFWPRDVMQDSQKWLNKAIKSGEASGIKLSMGLRFDKNGDFLKENSELEMIANIKDITLECCGKSFPVLNKINGKIKMDLNKFTAQIDSAESFPQISFLKTVVLLDFLKQKLSIDGSLNAQVKNLLNFYKKDYKVEILGDDVLKNIVGDANARFQIETNIEDVDKHGDLKQIDKDIEIISKNIDTNLENNKIHIKKGDLKVTIKNDDLEVKLKASVNNKPFKFDGKINIEDSKLNIEDKKLNLYEIQFNENYSKLKKTLDPIIGQLVKIKNNIAGKISIQQSQKNNFLNMNLKLDLQDTEIIAQYAKINKKIGDKANLNFKLNVQDDSYEVKDFVFHSGDRDIKIDNIEYKDQQINVNNLIFNENNLINCIYVDMTKDKEQIVNITAEDIFYEDFDWLGFTSDDKKIEKQKIFINGDVENLIFHDKSKFSKIKFEIGCRDGDCQEISIFNHDEKNTIAASLVNGRILIDTNNAGLLINGLNIAHTIRGGKLSLEGYQNRYSSDEVLLENSVEIKNFTIRNAPFLAQIISFVSISGLLTSLTGNGVAFNKMNSSFTFYNDKVLFAKSVSDGESMGIGFEGELDLSNEKMNISGSLMPFNFINIIIRRIPFFGDMLVGTRGNGLFSFDFKMKGGIDNPNVAVNPLKVFTPYFIKKFFNNEKKS